MTADECIDCRRSEQRRLSEVVHQMERASQCIRNDAVMPPMFRASLSAWIGDHALSMTLRGHLDGPLEDDFWVAYDLAVQYLADRDAP